MSNAIKRLSMENLEESLESALSKLFIGRQEYAFVVLCKIDEMSQRCWWPPTIAGKFLEQRPVEISPTKP